MILSGRFNPGELFGSERTLVKASQKIMDQMDEGCSPTCTTKQQHTTSPLTPEMESFMLNFYLSDLKLCTMQLAGFSKTVTENHNILDITDQDGRRCRYVGNRHKGQKQPSVIKVLGGRGHLFGRVCFFLQHDVCGKVHNWIIADTFLTAEKLEKYYFVEEKVLCRRLLHVSVISKPLVHVKSNGGLWILNAD